MIEFINTQMHLLQMAAAVLVTGAFALSGLRRTVDAETEETAWAYRLGHLRKTIVLGAISVALMASLPYTPKGYDGVVISLASGIQDEEVGGGRVNFVWPLLEHVTNVNTKIQTFTHNDENVYQHTADTQEIRIPISVNYQVTDASYVLEEVQGGPVPLVQNLTLRSLRDEIGDYSLENVAPNQAEINVAIEDTLNVDLKSQGIQAVFVSIIDTIPRPGILEAIEAEKIAERQKITAEHNLDIAKTNADAAAETADGEGRAVERLAAAREREQAALGLSPSEYIWFKTWNGQLPTVIGEASEFILPIPETTSPTSPETEESVTPGG